MKVTATDADEVNTLHSQIYYSIVEKSASDKMFAINYQTGEILVRRTTLDREVREMPWSTIIQYTVHLCEHLYDTFSGHFVNI
jgi:hypothetical protein